MTTTLKHPSQGIFMENAFDTFRKTRMYTPSPSEETIKWTQFVHMDKDPNDTFDVCVIEYPLDILGDAGTYGSLSYPELMQNLYDVGNELVIESVAAIRRDIFVKITNGFDGPVLQMLWKDRVNAYLVMTYVLHIAKEIQPQTYFQSVIKASTIRNTFNRLFTPIVHEKIVRTELQRIEERRRGELHKRSKLDAKERWQQVSIHGPVPPWAYPLMNRDYWITKVGEYYVNRLKRELVSNDKIDYDFALPSITWNVPSEQSGYRWTGEGIA